MAILAQNIKLNLVPGGIIPVVNVSQFDVGRVLRFTIYDGHGYADIPSGTTASIEGLKPSNKAFTYNATISDNIVTVSTVEQMTIEGGDVICKLKLLNGSQNIGTAMFIMNVEVAGITDGVDTSETVLPAYMEAGRQYMLGAEAWSKGTKDGVAVGSDQPQYHNNAKYWSGVAETSGTAWVNTLNSTGREWSNITKGYADEALNAATRAENAKTLSDRNVDTSRRYSEQALQNADNGRLWAKSWAVYSNNADQYGHDLNNAQYWADRARYFYDKTVSLAGSMQQKLNSVITVLKMLVGSINICTQSGDGILTQGGDHLVINFADNLYLTTNAGDRVITENGNYITATR